MKIETTAKDLFRFLIITWIVMIFMFGYLVYKDVKHDAAITLARIANQMDSFNQNFQNIDTGFKSLSAAINELKLANQIKGNIIESGKIEDLKK